MFDNIKVIAADIDGTLAKTAVNPSAYTLDTIRDLQDAGYLFGLASGRPADDVVNKYKVWGAARQFDFIIGWNGCELIDLHENKKYQYNKLKKEWIKEIIDFMAEFNANIHMYLPGVYIASSDTDNDNEMLRISNGVCLKDGNENTKKLAKYVTEEGCEDDGFAKFIHRYVL